MRLAFCVACGSFEARLANALNNAATVEAGDELLMSWGGSA